MSKSQILHENVYCELIVTTKCNLSCKYCIAHDLAPMSMSLECGKKAIELFVYLGYGATTIEFIITGGEPLLNFGVIRQLVPYAEEISRKNNMSPFFVLKTNGVLIDYNVIDLCIKYNIKFVVSIDGLKKFHDSFRVTAQEHSSHSQVVSSIKMLKENCVKISASLTVHPLHANHIMENINFLSKLGIDEIDIGPVYGTVHWRQNQIDAFINSLRLCASYIRKVNKNKFFEVSPINHQSEHIDNKLKDNWGCKAGVNNLAFLPNGNIAGCSSLAMLSPKKPTTIIGNVESGVDESLLSAMLNYTQATRDERLYCNECETKNNCAGGCVAINLSSTASPLIPPDFYCEIISTIPQCWEIAWG